MKNALTLVVSLFAIVGGTAGSPLAIYNNGVVKFIPGTDRQNNLANGINNEDSVAGALYVGGTSYEGFISSGGVLTPLLPFGASSAQAYNVNNVGVVIGGYNLAGSAQTHTFLYSQGAFTDFAFPSAAGTVGTDINDSGEIVGFYDLVNFVPIPFVYSGGAYTTLPKFPGSTETWPWGVNDAGQIVGFYVVGPPGTGSVHGFLYSGGTYTTIDFPGAEGTYPHTINNLGQIVGLEYSRTQGLLNGYSFLYSGGAYTTLDSVPLAGIRSINDAGALVGTYEPLFSTPETGSFLLAGCGLCMLLLHRVMIPRRLQGWHELLQEFPYGIAGISRAKRPRPTA